MCWVWVLYRLGCWYLPNKNFIIELPQKSCELECYFYVKIKQFCKTDLYFWEKCPCDSIDASKCFVKRRKNIGNKRVDLDDSCIKMILEAYTGFENTELAQGALTVESKVFDNAFFGYTKVTVETPIADEQGNIFNGIKTPVPPIEIQKKISVSLINKSAQIGQLIEKQQEQIEKLKEYKQAVINEAVTKGLNPTAPMKDSGIEWIGEIPEEWNCKKIKYLFSESMERNTYETYELLTFSATKGLLPFAQHTDKPPSAEDLSNYKVIHIGELCLNRMQAWHGVFTDSLIEGCVSPDYAVFKPYPNANVRYYTEKMLHKKSHTPKSMEYNYKVMKFSARFSPH